MVPIVSPGGVTGWCLDPFDLAYNKLEAGREKDLQYVAVMICSDITPAFSLETYFRQHAPNEEVFRKLMKSLRKAEAGV